MASGMILVVDDDDAGRRMLAFSCRQAGLRVLTASNGPEALEVLRREPVRFMVTDGKMKPMDGLELSRKAKVLQPELRIALFSAVYTDADARPYPIDTVFSKPVQVDPLIAWIRNRLAGSIQAAHR